MSAHVDVVVVGSGAAGVAAAVSAARAGASTLLIDQNSFPGGTGGFGGLTTLCGLHTDEGQFLNDGFAREFADALRREDDPGEPLKMGRLFVQLYRPETFQAVAAGLIADETRIETRWNTPVSEVVLHEGRIQSLNGFPVGAVIDCTGTAEVGRAAGEELLATDETTQSPAVVFKLENVERDLRSPIGVAMVLLHLAHAGLPPLSFMPCVDPGTVAVKFSGSPTQVPGLLKFLQTEVSGFQKCRTAQTDFTIARRAGAMIMGHYVLTGSDVLGARKFADAVARGCWPVEQWSADGRQSIRYLPPGDYYEIPARSLHAARTENLFMAGKSLSADVDAIASARVIGCCLATGAAAGKLAAESLQSARAA